MKIHLVKTRLVNSYIVEYPDRLLVIDVAIKCHRYVMGFIDQQLKRPISDVALVVCTHDDPDHIGGVFALASLCSAEVAIPYAAKRNFNKWFNNPYGPFVRMMTSSREMLLPRAWQMYLSPQRNRAAQRQFKLNTEQKFDKSASSIEADYRLKDGETLPGFDEWQVVHTPGHSWDSICFFHVQSASLVTGDTLLGSAQKGLVVPSIYASRSQTLVSLEKLAQLNIHSVYPGHGNIITGDQLIGTHNLLTS